MQIYRVTETFPRDEQFGLTSQMRRAAVSIPANIAEGCARKGVRDYLRFLRIAMGSLRELEYFLCVGQELGYLEPDAASAVMEAQQETARTLGALIRFFESRVDDSNP